MVIKEKLHVIIVEKKAMVADNAADLKRLAVVLLINQHGFVTIVERKATEVENVRNLKRNVVIMIRQQ